MKETGEWGEFFPIMVSPFAYNETVAQEYFPMTEKESLAREYRWREEDVGAVSNHKIPNIEDNIVDVDNSILDKTLVCEATKKPYRLIKSELEFYRKMNLPIPRLHPDERHQKRMALRNPRKLWERSCANCQKNIKTTYAPDRPEKVLCESCYLEVVQ